MKLPTKKLRYWHHPESYCVWNSSDPGDERLIDESVEEIDHQEYLRLYAEYKHDPTDKDI